MFFFALIHPNYQIAKICHILSCVSETIPILFCPGNHELDTIRHGADGTNTLWTVFEIAFDLEVVYLFIVFELLIPRSPYHNHLTLFWMCKTMMAMTMRLSWQQWTIINNTLVQITMAFGK